MYLTYLLLQIYDFITLRITSSKEIYRSFLELKANRTCTRASVVKVKIAAASHHNEIDQLDRQKHL